MKNRNKPDDVFALMLQNAGFRITSGRLELLRVLASAKKPLSVATVVKALNKKADQATVYRALEDLANKGVINRVDLRHGHAHFEFVPKEKHHHHLVCTSCGALEDMKCPVRIPKTSVHSKKFKDIRDHSAEFFSLCNSCTTHSRASR